MAGSLITIRKRIKSVKNTKKITKAMQLVAASKMKFFQKKALSSRAYSWELLKLLKKNLNEDIKSELIEQRTEGRTLFVLYTSDKGLCGPLNTKMIKTLFNSNIWNKTPKEERLVFTIGKKSFDYAQYNNIKVEKSFKGLKEKLESMEALEIVDDIVHYWLSKDIKKVVMVAPHYKNSLVFYPVIKTYLPFSSEMVEEHINLKNIIPDLERFDEINIENDDVKDPIIEPSKESLVEVLVANVIEALFLQSFFELKASEYSSRMIAMQNATDAANEMIDKLTLTFNKARQAAITQEIAEIVGGSL